MLSSTAIETLVCSRDGEQKQEVPVLSSYPDRVVGRRR